MSEGRTRARVSRIAEALLLFPAAFLVLISLGCSTPNETFVLNMVAGRHWFENGRFNEAVTNFKNALEEEPDNYDAALGLANSSAEYSHELYSKGAELLGTKSPEGGIKQIADADKVAGFANRAFGRALKLQEDTGDDAHRASYGYGLFLYKRATSQRNFPYPMTLEAPPELGKEERARWEAGYKRRLQELDMAIEQFEIVLADDPKDAGTPEHPRKCRSNTAHRYLGLALFVRSDWSRRDGERARKHTIAHLSYLLYVRESVLRVPYQTEDQKIKKQKEVQKWDVEIVEIKNLIRDRLTDLKDYEGQIRASKEVPPLAPADRQQRLAAVAVEIAAVSELVEKFEKASSAPPDAPREQGKP